jgi:hypothetical protein
MPPRAAPCRCSQSRRRKYALLIGTLAYSQAEGRGFESRWGRHNCLKLFIKFSQFGPVRRLTIILCMVLAISRRMKLACWDLQDVHITH